MKINKYKLMLCGFAVLLFLIVNYFGGRADKNKFLRFYNRTINGRLTYIKLHNASVDIAIDNQKFTFAPIDVSNQTEFIFFVKKGDSVLRQLNQIL